jgi:Tol biopolymer transport system component
VLYYVMPFVEGQSLRQRIAREGELPVGDAVRILMEVADALAYAHSRGVVHRDIKPDNIMLTGRHAVVADFGVARAVSEAASTGTLTSLGVALGTPAYMAPEQAVADPHVDQRADIYALGIVAYELLAGRTPFAGATPQQMLAAHVTEKPDPPSRHRPGISPVLEQALMRCLEKRAADRFQTADELLAILEPLATPSGGTAPTAARLRPAASPGLSLRSQWLVIGAVVLIAAAFAAWRWTRDEPPRLELGRATHVTAEPGLEINPDISPDGRLVAYAAGNFARMRVFIRPVAGGRTIPLSDDSTAVERQPRWSPDGTQILFLTRGGVSIGPSLGGTSRPVVPPSATSEVLSASWSPDGARILFVRGDTLYAAAADGSGVDVLASGRELHSCRWSADAVWIACVTLNSRAEEPGPVFGNLAPSAIVVFPGGGGAGVQVTDMSATSQSPVWSRDGDRLYFISNRDGPRDIYAIRIDRSGKARGVAERLTTGLGAIWLSLSGDGERLAYAAYTARANLWSLPIPPGGPINADGATALTTGNQVIEFVRPSRDGRWILYDSNLGGRSHIWRVPIGGGQPEQLTNGPADEFAGDLSPDGRLLAYHSWRTGTRDIEVIPLAGGVTARVTDTPEQESYPLWSPDGTKILFVEQTPGSRTLHLVERTPDGGWSSPSLFASGFSRSWSPDGREIAYVELDVPPIGRMLARRVSGGEPREIFTPGAGDPIAIALDWASDGRIYFKSHDDAGRASFWSINPSGGRPQHLVRFDDLSRPSSRTDFAVFGNLFYFPIEDRQSDVYVVEVTGR